MGFELDDVDRGILELLQEDARHNTAVDIADAVDVTANTVRNRIRRLEEEGAVRGYVPVVDYDRIGKPLHVLVECTAPIHERGELAAEVATLEGVVAVREVMSGRRNLRIELAAADTDEVTATASRLQRRGLDVEAELLVTAERRRPFDHFGTDAVDR